MINTWKNNYIKELSVYSDYLKWVAGFINKAVMIDHWRWCSNIITEFFSCAVWRCLNCTFLYILGNWNICWKDSLLRSSIEICKIPWLLVWHFGFISHKLFFASGQYKFYWTSYFCPLSSVSRNFGIWIFIKKFNVSKMWIVSF